MKPFPKKLLPPLTCTFLIVIDELRTHLAAKTSQFISAVNIHHNSTAEQQLRFYEDIVYGDALFTFQCVMPANRVG